MKPTYAVPGGRTEPRRLIALMTVLSIAASACTRTVIGPAPQPTPDTGRVSQPRPRNAPRFELSRSIVAVPAARREMRGVWIATVDNIDWPTAPALSVAQQKAELLALLDEAKRLHLNTIVFQIRPTADAFYESSLEPWSRYLTGETGRPPDPRYDPLAFAITEAHARGLELHAWFNPFRASLTTKTIASPAHVTNARPDLVVTYGTMKWLDPGLEEARAHSLRVIADVVKRYDVDAVHLDDYFYPYVQQDAAGRNIPFPDANSYARYAADGGTLSLGDWRRDNINRFVQAMYETVHRTKPWVQVGISPFGIWRPGSPPDVRGLDSYAEIYADARLWLRSGWVDYIAPQLYWLTDAQYQPYTSLTRWWVGENVMNREVVFGNAPFRMNEKGWSAGEVVRQIELTRAQSGASGNIYFSAKSFLRGPNAFADALASGIYDRDVLTPAMPWLGTRASLQMPRAEVHVDARERLITIDWRPRNPAPRAWLLRTRSRGEWTEYVLPGDAETKTVAYDATGPDAITLSMIARNGVEGPPVVFTDDR